MQRRHVLALAAASASAVALGLGVASWTPGLQNAHLTPAARRLMSAVASVVLSGMRPPTSESTLAEHLNRLDQIVAGLPNATRSEISDLLGILSITPGRWALAGLADAWPLASERELSSALQDMRTSRIPVQRQAYQALRDLTMAAHFSAEGSWRHLGYPGPKPL